jgi:hypothetical protein
MRRHATRLWFRDTQLAAAKRVLKSYHQRRSCTPCATADRDTSHCAARRLEVQRCAAQRIWTLTMKCISFRVVNKVYYESLYVRSARSVASRRVWVWADSNVYHYHLTLSFVFVTLDWKFLEPFIAVAECNNSFDLYLYDSIQQMALNSYSVLGIFFKLTFHLTADVA